MIGYDFEKRVYELLRGKPASPEEEIRFVSFLDDHNPAFIFIVTYDVKEQKSSIKILKIKKN